MELIVIHGVALGHKNLPKHTKIIGEYCEK